LLKLRCRLTANLFHINHVAGSHLLSRIGTTYRELGVQVYLRGPSGVLEKLLQKY
jgi:hypothetical protein